MNDEVRALAVFDDGTGPALYVASGFGTAGGLQANRIGRWNASGWSTLRGGMDGGVWTPVAPDGALYAGGHFGTAGGTAANRMRDGRDDSPAPDRGHLQSAMASLRPGTVGHMPWPRMCPAGRGWLK